MPEFQYTARTDAGERVQGSLDADSEAAVLRMLGEKNLFPVTVLARQAGHTAHRKDKPAARRKVRSRDVGVMYGQLADLLGSGVPLLRALDSLVRSTVNPRLVSILKEIRKEVADGKSLTDSLRQFPESFPSLHTAMVQAGERASFLEDVLRSLSEFLERLDELRGKVMGALIYPLMLTLAGCAVMIAALVVFVPKFEPLLEGQAQPLPTQVIFFLSHLVRGHWYVLVIVCVAMAFGLWSAMRSRTGRLWMERWRMKVPVLGLTLRMVAITRFCRILGTMMANGVPLLQALSISKNATGSPMMAERIAEASENVRAGRKLTEPLAEGGMFPAQILAMLSVAEESNSLEKVLLQIANTVERRTSRQIDTAVRLVEPVILCLVAAGIGFLALGLLLPVFTMAASLGSQ